MACSFFSWSLCYCISFISVSRGLFRLSSAKDMAIAAMIEKIVKKIIGLIPLSSISSKINCPELEATAPKAEATPNPKPLTL